MSDARPIRPDNADDLRELGWQDEIAEEACAARRPGLPKPYYEEPGIVIYHADCRDILPLLPKVDLVLTDPPYGIGYDARGGIGNARRTVFEFSTVAGDAKAFDPSFLLAYGSRQIIWGADHFLAKLPNFGRLLIWYKRTEKRLPESVQFADAELAWDSCGSLVRVIRHVQDGFISDGYGNVGRIHPTQKPETVMAWCLSIARDSAFILDPFMGSGTTLVAAKQLGRRCIGIEIEEKYCAIAVDRLRQAVLPLEPPAPQPEQLPLEAEA